MTRLFFVTLCVLAAVLPAAMGMGATAQAAPAPTVDPAPECGSLSEYDGTEEYRNCLSEHTDTEEIMAITSTAPANVSTKATDAIYAVDVDEANDTVANRVLDWQTWEMFGLEPGWTEAARNATTSTATPTPTATATASSTPTATPNASTSTATGPSIDVAASAEADTLATQETIRMGEHTEIVGWEFSDGEVSVAIATERTQYVTLTDGAAGIGESGATTIPSVDKRIFGGETTIITMPVEQAFGGYVVGVSAGDSGVRLSTEMSAESNDPLRHFGGQSGLFSGMLMAVLTSIGGAWWVLRSEEKGVKKA